MNFPSSVNQIICGNWCRSEPWSTCRVPRELSLPPLLCRRPVAPPCRVARRKNLSVTCCPPPFKCRIVAGDSVSIVQKNNRRVLTPQGNRRKFYSSELGAGGLNVGAVGNDGVNSSIEDGAFPGNDGLKSRNVGGFSAGSGSTTSGSGVSLAGGVSTTWGVSIGSGTSTT